MDVVNRYRIQWTDKSRIGGAELTCVRSVFRTSLTEAEAEWEDRS